MPEVPELLTLRNNLLKRFRWQRLDKLDIAWEKKLTVPKSEIIQAIEGARLNDIVRSGKTVQFRFDNGQILGMHLMATGKPYLIPSEKDVKRSVFEMIFEFGLGFGVYDYTGQVRLVLNPESNNIPDVFSEDLTFEYLKSILSKSRHKLLKPILTDQKLIRGLGNAYVDEILWEIKVSPSSVASMVPDQKVHELLSAINSVLSDAQKSNAEITGEDELMVEKRSFLKVHNSRRSKDPNGEEIQSGEIGKAKTYWTNSQVLYRQKQWVFGKEV